MADLATQHDMVFLTEIEANNKEERTEIAQLIHIDSIVFDRVYAVINLADLNALKENSAIKILSVETLSDPDKVNDYYAPFIGPAGFPPADSAFHTYDEVHEKLIALANAHPDVAEVFSIGKSVENRDIWAMRLTIDSADSVPAADKKAIVYMGTHHAREHVSTEIPIQLIEEILQLLSDPEVQALLKEIIMYIIPLVNPDGAEHDIASHSYRWWRKNRQSNNDGSFGVDLNRNYGYGWGTGGSSSSPSSDIFKGVAPFSEPETAAIRDFFVANPNITIALSFHTFSELILYPWGGRHAGVGGDDQKLFEKMAGDMAAMNHYTPMQSSDLYIASGDTCDWLYGQLKVFCFTFELSPRDMFGGGFYPGAGIIEQVFQDNWDPIMYLAKAADNPRQLIVE